LLLCVKPKLQCSNWLISFDWTERAVMSILLFCGCSDHG
jgi:hypothetical protein